MPLPLAASRSAAHPPSAKGCPTTCCAVGESITTWGPTRPCPFGARIEFVPAMPLGPSGKILKRELVKNL